MKEYTLEELKYMLYELSWPDVDGLDIETQRKILNQLINVIEGNKK